MGEFLEDTVSACVCRTLQFPSGAQLNTRLLCAELSTESPERSHPEREGKGFVLLCRMTLFVTDAFVTWSPSHHLPNGDELPWNQLLLILTLEVGGEVSVFQIPEYSCNWA